MDACNLFGEPIPAKVHGLQTKPENVQIPRQDWVPRHDTDREWARKADQQAFGIPAASVVETCFRHRGWISDRKKVRTALCDAGCSASRLDRFDACGSDCIVEVNENGSAHRIKANHCGDRFCIPCSTARSGKASDRFTKLIQGQAATHLVLTLLNREGNLPDILNHLYRSFSKLREHGLWQRSVRAGVAVCEIKIGKNSGLWHVHLHCLLLASYIDSGELSAAWLKATGDSHILKLRRIRDEKMSVSYIAKYATKGFCHEIVNLPDRLIECVCALRGRRLFNAFGAWRGIDLDPEHQSHGEWRRVGRLDAIYNAAKRGEAWASGVLRSLGVELEGEGEGVGLRSIDRGKYPDSPPSLPSPGS